jgi:hypothetical protein
MSRAGRVPERRRPVVPVALALLALVVAQPRPAVRAQADGGDLLAALDAGGDKLGWDGIQLGMSLVQAERKLGVTLGLEKGVSKGCPAFVASGTRNGVTLTMGFPNPKPGAKIEWLRVRFGGESLVLASGPELAAALRAKLPEVAWIAPADQPGATEAEDYTPAYRVPGKEPAVVEFVPRESMTIAYERCAG